jgi:hypothetical protein
MAVSATAHVRIDRERDDRLKAPSFAAKWRRALGNVTGAELAMGLGIGDR